jgi:hypothetical protein
MWPSHWLFSVSQLRIVQAGERNWNAGAQVHASRPAQRIEFRYCLEELLAKLPLSVNDVNQFHLCRTILSLGYLIMPPHKTITSWLYCEYGFCGFLDPRKVSTDKRTAETI